MRSGERSRGGIRDRDRAGILRRDRCSRGRDARPVRHKTIIAATVCSPLLASGRPPHDPTHASCPSRRYRRCHGRAAGTCHPTRDRRRPCHGPAGRRRIPLQDRQLRADRAQRRRLEPQDRRQVRPQRAAGRRCRRRWRTHFLPADTLPIPFTTLVVNTGSKLILIDTGTGGQLAPHRRHRSRANLAAAGIDPKAVDIILISHFHPDHINGLKTKDDALRVPQCRDQGAGRRMGVLDGRRQDERGAGGRAPRVPQRASRVQRHRQGREAIRAGQGSRRPASRRSPPTATRPATPPSRSPRATSRCWCWATRPTIRGCSCAIRNGRRSSTRTAVMADRDAQEAARPRLRRQDAGAGLSLPLPGLRVISAGAATATISFR